MPALMLKSADRRTPMQSCARMTRHGTSTSKAKQAKAAFSTGFPVDSVHPMVQELQL